MVRKSSDLLARLGGNLRSLREERGLTQEQVGERAGYTAKYISEIERGHRYPPLTTLARLSEKGLGYPLSRVIEAGSAPRPRQTETTPEPQAPLPRAVRDVAEQIARVASHQQRSRILRLVRELVALVRSSTS
jgi:transcriptional regulator with XRE-family HTH domain